MWNTAAVEMLMRLVEVEMLGIGRMGHRGLIGHRLVQEEKLKMLVWLVVLITRRVFVGETKRGGDVQRMGLETRPPGSARRGQTRQPATRANPGEGRRIGRGCPRARRSPDASTCGGKRPRL